MSHYSSALTSLLVMPLILVGMFIFVGEILGNDERRDSSQEVKITTTNNIDEQTSPESSMNEFVDTFFNTVFISIGTVVLILGGFFLGIFIAVKISEHRQTKEWMKLKQLQIKYSYLEEICALDSNSTIYVKKLKDLIMECIDMQDFNKLGELEAEFEHEIWLMNVILESHAKVDKSEIKQSLIDLDTSIKNYFENKKKVASDEFKENLSIFSKSQQRRQDRKMNK